MLYIKFRRGRKILNQLVVPDSLVPDVLQLKHDEAGHMSSSKTRKLIQREYYWLSVNEDTRRYCQTCSVCATCKDPPRETTTDANLTSQPTEPWQEVSMDLKGPFGPQSTSRGNRYLLVVLDLLTRVSEMIPIPNKTAKTVANAVVTEVFCRHGIPESILTDKGLEFDSSAMLVLATELGIDKKRISALHPQANGAVERLNRTIGQMLKKTQEGNDLDWDLKIPFVRFNYLNQEHSSTGYSPFYLTFGRNPRTPVLVKDSSMPKPKTPQQWATDLAKTLEEAHDVSSTRDRLQKEKRAEKSKEVLTTQRFKVGDEVLVYSPTRKGQVKSLHRAWAGPYIVIQCREGNTYRIKNSDNFRQRFIRHHDQLRYLHSRPLHLTKPSQADVTDDKPVHDIQPSGVPKKPTTSTNTVPPSTSLPTFGDSDDESDEDSDNGEGEPQENGEAPGGSTEPETARRSQRQRREPQRFGEYDVSHVSKFYLAYKRNNDEIWRWRQYRENEVTVTVFENNETITNRHTLLSPHIARYVRLVAVKSLTNRACFKVELYGCPWTKQEGLVSYRVSQGNGRADGPGLGDLRDVGYDGRRLAYGTKRGVLSGGLGQLVDGELGMNVPWNDTNNTGALIVNANGVLILFNQIKNSSHRKVTELRRASV
ncbi:hypothetical protein QZH41_003542 [Actinostola sp. cb2023]|nr:hypothetical protein QZH41_003542 [Actinostola sp. cb2023]